MSTNIRDITLDRIRTLCLLLMLVDHTLHAYALYWGKFWFVYDSERDVLYDVLYLHNNSIIIPLLFFVSGHFVYQSWLKHRFIRYALRRFIHLMIPAILGVLFLVPLMSYGKFVQQGENNLGFISFLTQSFFAGKTLQAGPMWVLYVIFAHSILAATLFQILGKQRVERFSVQLAQKVSQNPLTIMLPVMILCIFLLGFSDLRWGAPWWIGWGKVFSVQGSRFLVQALFFWLGVMRGTVPLHIREQVMDTQETKYKSLFIAWLIVGIAYITYAIGWFDAGAYSDEVYRHFIKGGRWSEVWPVVKEYGSGVWIRTTLHSIYLPVQVALYVFTVHKCKQRNWGFVDRISPYGLGLFLFHPIFVIWLQVAFDGVTLPALFKILIIVPIALGGALLISRWGLRLYYKMRVAR